MKILYLPCHSILEYDQYNLWTELGHEVFSIGSYVNPQSPHDAKRPAIPEGKYNEDLVRLSAVYSRDRLHPEFVEWADVIVVDHIPDWIVNNWPVVRKKPVVWRTIGQSIDQVENALRPLRKQGLLVVRYSPKERTIPGYIGEDAMIRFYKDPAEFNGWTGEVARVMTVAQAIKRRGAFCHYDAFLQATDGLPRVLYGPSNEDAGEVWGGLLSYDEMKAELRRNRVFFYTGTQPAGYTLGFIEAMMTGIPVVALGPKWGNSIFGDSQDTYEVKDILRTGCGFCSDYIGSLQKNLQDLLDDVEYAGVVGRAGRDMAIALFGKKTIARQWAEFFNGI